MISNRRDFLKSVSLFAIFGSTIQWLGQSAKAAGLKLIDMKQNLPVVETAKGINYVEDLAKALAAKKIKKEEKVIGAKKIKPAEQTCDTCMFFDMQKKGEDTCTLLPGVLVHKKGSCNSWAPKS